MANRIEDSGISVVGIDLAKNSFHIHAVDAAGGECMSRKVSRQQLPIIMAKLPPSLVGMDERIAVLDREIEQIAATDERCRRLLTIPGVGPLSATALIAAIDDIETFKNGRELAAWLGLVPRQSSTGGKDSLLGISKRGDVYVRQLLIHGARSVLRFVDKKTDTRSRWAQSLIQRRNKNIAAVAMANKMARTVYALLEYEQEYRARSIAV